MSTLKVTNIQHGSATNTAMVLDTAGTVKAYSTISVGNVTPSSSGAGITFPATASASSDANTLDDYEEGTFTPTIYGSTSAGTGTYQYQAGSYTKIGRLVNALIGLEWNAHTGTGNMYIGGLPFVPGTDSPATIGQISNIALTAGNVPLAQAQNDSSIRFWQYPTGGGAGGYVPIDTAGYFYISITYRI